MADDPKPFHNPFGALAALKASLPVKPEPTPELKPVDPQLSSREAAKGPARAVVRVERAGRGGKVVTVVEHLGLNPMELERWLKDLKAGLGCGGVVDGGTLVLQGSHRERLVNLLAARGVKKVTIGS
jgi:translation initiation factor 1